MIKLITILFFIFYFNNLNAQDWLKKSVPADLNHTCLIIEKIDSIGKKCKDGKKLVYCHDFEKNIDKQLSSLQNIQETSFQNYKHDYILVLPKAFPYQEFTDLKDVNKYRYILKMHYHPPTNEKDNFPIWMYYFYDRKTNKTYHRIHQIQDSKFKNLKDLIAGLNAKFETIVKK